MIARKYWNALAGTALVLTLVLSACSKLESPLKKTATAKPEPTQPSTIKVEVNDGGPAVLTTATAEFQVRPDGYVQASLLKDGKKLSLDESSVGSPADSDFVRIAGKDVHFTLDFQQAQVHEAIGKLGVGKRVEIPARPLGPSGMNLQRVLALEVYDKFPNILLSTVEYKNIGTSEVAIEKSVNQRRRLNAGLGDAKVHPWEMWSYHGSSYDWGKDDVVKLTPVFPSPTSWEKWSKAVMGAAFRWWLSGRARWARRWGTWRLFRFRRRFRQRWERMDG